MAVEVDQGGYQYLPVKPSLPQPQPQPQPTAVSRKDLLRMEHAGKKQDAVGSTLQMSTKTTYIFSYNPLHDMESVLWIAFHALVNNERKLASDPDSDAIALTEEERETAAKLFYNAAERVNAMRSENGIINKALRNLPEPLKSIGESLLELKALLIDRYTTVEADPASIGANACGDLYDRFDNNFRFIRNTLDKLGDVTVEPIKVELDHSDRVKRRLTKGSTRSSSKRTAADDLSQGSKKQKTTVAT